MHATGFPWSNNSNNFKTMITSDERPTPPTHTRTLKKIISFF